MGQSAISEKEFQVIRQIASNGVTDNSGVNQRMIARQTGMSLGLTNLIIKRLVNKGYVKLQQLTARKIQYFLTPKGLTEKAKKSYRFTLRTIETLKQMKQQIQEVMLAEYRKGIRRFVIKGEGELAGLVKISFEGFRLPEALCCGESDEKSLKNEKNKIPPEKVLTLLTDEKLDEKVKGNYINLIRLLSDKLG